MKKVFYSNVACDFGDVWNLKHGQNKHSAAEQGAG